MCSLGVQGQSLYTFLCYILSSSFLFSTMLPRIYLTAPSSYLPPFFFFFCTQRDNCSLFELYFLSVVFGKHLQGKGRVSVGITFGAFLHSAVSAVNYFYLLLESFCFIYLSNLICLWRESNVDISCVIVSETGSLLNSSLKKLSNNQ